MATYWHGEPSDKNVSVVRLTVVPTDSGSEAQAATAKGRLRCDTKPRQSSMFDGVPLLACGLGSRCKSNDTYFEIAWVSHSRAVVVDGAKLGPKQCEFVRQLLQVEYPLDGR